MDIPLPNIYGSYKPGCVEGVFFFFEKHGNSLLNHHLGEDVFTFCQGSYANPSKWPGKNG